MNETRLRLRGWWRRHWWLARIRRLDEERLYWKHNCRLAEERLAEYRKSRYVQEFE